MTIFFNRTGEKEKWMSNQKTPMMIFFSKLWNDFILFGLKFGKRKGTGWLLNTITNGWTLIVQHTGWLVRSTSRTAFKTCCRVLMARSSWNGQRRWRGLPGRCKYNKGVTINEFLRYIWSNTEEIQLFNTELFNKRALDVRWCLAINKAQYGARPSWL